LPPTTGRASQDRNRNDRSTIGCWDDVPLAIGYRGTPGHLPLPIPTLGLTGQPCTADRIRMTTTTGASETWQARITHELAAQLRDDAELLGLDGRTEIVKAALELLHKQAAEERMARSVDSFYAGREPALPIGVRSSRRAEADVPA